MNMQLRLIAGTGLFLLLNIFCTRAGNVTGNLPDSPGNKAFFQEHQSPVKPEKPAAAQPLPSVEVLSTTVVDSLDGIQRDRWLPETPSTHQDIVLRIRVKRGFGYATTDFALTFQSAKKPQKVKCIGVTAMLPNGWVFSDAAKNWSFYPGGEGTLDGLGILFLLPKDVSEVTLLYKDQPAGNSLVVKRQ